MSQAELVKSYRKVIEKMYEHTCDVIIRSLAYNPDTFRDEDMETYLYENQACRISFENQSVDDKELVTTSKNIVKMFIAPEVDIPDSSKIVVNINGETIEFSKSTEPFIYSTHKEYALTYFTKGN